MREFLRRPWTAPLALLLVCLTAYGITITRQGFYWDDWTIVWYTHFLGPSSFPAAFASDRPLLAWIYQITTPLLGESPLSWQVFAIFTRWLACAALWWALHGLWPDRLLQTTAVAILFAIYPGFKQQHIAITYGNAFIILAIYLSSWALMIWALRKPLRFWVLYLASLPLALFSVFTAEHFFGLELLRPVFLWIVLADSIPSIRNRLKRTALLWLPYLAIDLLFLAWRISHPTPRAQITLFAELASNPLGTVLSLGQTVLQDIFTVSVKAWGQVFNLTWLSTQPGRVAMFFLLILTATGAWTVLALAGRARAGDPDAKGIHHRRWALLAIGLGIFSLLIGGIPIWPTSLRIELFFPWDRFTLPMMFGAALLLVGLIELLSFLPYQNIILVAIFAGLAAGFHYQNALSYQADWLAQKEFFWQLAWRAPGIKPGTILLTSEMPFEYDWDNSLTAPLNWTYAPDMHGTDLPYLMYNAESRLSSGLPDLEQDTQIEEYLRITPFKGSISQAIVAFYRPPGTCLKVIDPQLDQNLPDKPRFFKNISSFSDPGLILTDADPAAQPPLQFFGPEPQADWCYYYEKAELARQSGDWETVVEMGERALKLKHGIVRKNAHELLPFIEGYARTGDWKRALELTRKSQGAWENMRVPLCNLWGVIAAEDVQDEITSSQYAEIKTELDCREP